MDKQEAIEYWLRLISEAREGLQVWEIFLKAWAKREQVSDDEFMIVVRAVSAGIGDWLDGDKHLDVLREAVTGAEYLNKPEREEKIYAQNR